jgi:hypothetical protein
MSFADKLSYPQLEQSLNSAGFGDSWGCIPLRTVSALKTFPDEKRRASAAGGAVPVGRPRLLLPDGRRMLGTCCPRSAMPGRSSSCSSW